MSWEKEVDHREKELDFLAEVQEDDKRLRI